MNRFVVYRAILTLLISACFYPIWAQKNDSELLFEKVSHDFGQIKEEAGPVSYEFKWTNKSSKPLFVKQVVASCGCTTPFWSKDTLAPGKSGIVRAQFDPYNRPGQFNKTLTVTSNANPTLQILTITGTVVPKPKTSSENYPDKLGALRMQSRYLHLGDITTEKAVSKEFDLVNDGPFVIQVLDQMLVPEHIKITIDQKSLQPGEKTKIKLTYDPIKKNDYGYVYDQVEINTNERDEPKKNLIVSATIKPFAPEVKTADDVVNNPKMMLEKLSHDFGKIKQGDKVSTSFSFKNAGKKDLIIYKTKATCGCTASEPDKKILKAGESSQIQVTFDSAGKEGNQEKQINIYCNDPENVNPVILIKSFVVK